MESDRATAVTVWKETSLQYGTVVDRALQPKRVRTRKNTLSATIGELCRQKKG